MKKVRVKFVKQPGKFRLAYHPGEEGEFDEKQAMEMQKAGVVIPVEAKDSSDLPEDLPGRDAITKAGISYDELKDIQEYEEIAGIGKGTAAKLVEYFKNK